MYLCVILMESDWKTFMCFVWVILLEYEEGSIIWAYLMCCYFYIVFFLQKK
jgi:hypothetical protein